MAGAEKGRAFVLKQGDGATSEQFTTIGGARVTGFAFAGEDVSIQDKDDAGWETLLADAGKKSVALSLAGVFKDSAAEATLIAAAIAQTIDNYELYFENGDKFEGAWKVSGLEYTGPDNEPTQYTCTFSSSGVIGHTPA